MTALVAAAALAAVPSAHAAAFDPIFTLAGDGTVCASSIDPCGDGGPATLVQLSSPSGLATLPDGRVLVADTGNHRIRVVGRDGFLITLAGSGKDGFGGDLGPAVDAGLNVPHDIDATASGEVLVADTSNNRVRRFTPGGTIETVAGDGTAGFGGDDGPAKAAQLDAPSAVAALSGGAFLIADWGNNRIRRVSRDGRRIGTVAGTGRAGSAGDGGQATDAELNGPISLAVMPDDSFLISEPANNRIRRVASDGTISTFAGTGDAGFSGDGGPATGARLSAPTGIAVAPDGSVYIADSSNHRVRRVAPNGVIETVAGNGNPGYNGDGIDALTASLRRPIDVTATASGDVIVADRDNHRVRRIDVTGTVAPPPPVNPVNTPPVVDPAVKPRLVAALSASRFHARRGRRPRVTFVLTEAAELTVELRHRGRRVARLSRSAPAGRTRIRLPRLRRGGRYTLLLTARVADGRTATDRAVLRVTR
jgi:sugar lactone lactonase YvrE